LTKKRKELVIMTKDSEDILIERVPLPEIRKSEKLEPKILDAIMNLEPEESFFIKTDDEDHLIRKISTLRQRVHRVQLDNPDKRFTVRKRREADKGNGIRIYRLPNENNEPA
jgi:hypothetical protein